MKHPINERLVNYFNENKIKQVRVSELTGISTQTISNIFKDKFAPGSETLEAIFKAFPNINPIWVIMGTGSINLDKNNLIDETNNKTNLNSDSLTTKIIEDLRKDKEFLMNIISSKFFKDANGQGNFLKGSKVKDVPVRKLNTVLTALKTG